MPTGGTIYQAALWSNLGISTFLSLVFALIFVLKAVQPTHTHLHKQTLIKREVLRLSSHQGLLLHHFVVTDPLPIFFAITAADLSFDREQSQLTITSSAIVCSDFITSNQ